METRVANIAIIVRDSAVICDMQNILSEYSNYIVGRMGIPYKPKNVRVISVIIDAPIDILNALTGKIGKIPNVKAKMVCSDV